MAWVNESELHQSIWCADVKHRHSTPKTTKTICSQPKTLCTNFRNVKNPTMTPSCNNSGPRWHKVDCGSENEIVKPIHLTKQTSLTRAHSVVGLVRIPFTHRSNCKCNSKFMHYKTTFIACFTMNEKKITHKTILFNIKCRLKIPLRLKKKIAICHQINFPLMW